MTALSLLLDYYRDSSKSEREKGTYFEELMLCYLRNEATYRDLYSQGDCISPHPRCVIRTRLPKTT
jgi:predicted helicase